MADTPLLSVILCTRNGAATIGEQLDALAGQETTIPWELVVVDNGSTDSTVAVVEEHRQHLAPTRVVDASDRAGLPHARNVGVERAHAELVAFCDDDDVVGPGWVDAIHAALADHRLVASAIEYDLLNDPGVLEGRARFQGAGVETLFGIPVCAGACGVRRSLWNALGGNDESLSATGEDFDFAMRAHRLEGVVPHFAADAVYHHRLRSDGEHIYRQARAFGASHATLWARHGDSRIGPVDDLRHAVRDWWWVISRAPFVVAGRNRAIWLRRAGRRVGRLRGSLRERVVLL